MTVALYLLTIGLIPATILVVFAMKYVSAVFAARARLANDGAYRALAEAAAAGQAQAQASLTAIQADLARLSASVAAVEQILKQVG
jgi:hypothetical protein